MDGLSPSFSNSLPLLRRRLLRWFARHARALPWRRTRSPYAIWISEVMLQQTQVATVIPYFQRFLQKFPDVHRLAEADEQAVLRAWEGLGYYRRARNLHACARILVQEHGGEWPRDPRVAALLPGLGKYTVNAILSQAFDARLPILEANTRRVLCRLDAVRGDPARSDVASLLWKRAAELLPHRRAGDFNQALMELGALVCTPQKPRCRDCPLREHCQGRRLGLTEEIPARAAPPQIETIRELALVIERRGSLLLVQRSGEGRWENLWEFPHCVWPDNETLDACATRLLEGLGVDADLESERSVLRHGVTRFRITLNAWSARYAAGRFRPGLYAAARWVRPAQLADFPLSSPQRRLARIVTKPKQPQLF